MIRWVLSNCRIGSQLMPARNVPSIVSVSAFLIGVGVAQATLQVRPPGAAAPEAQAAPAPAPDKTIALTVPKGAPLEIGLDGDIRVKKAGQEIHARILQPVYPSTGS